MNDLTGKVAVITGAARGLGKACALAMAELGASVVITDILTAEGELTASELQAQGYQAAFVSHDVTSERDWQSVFDVTKEKFKTIDILVNNAGISMTSTIETLSLDQFRQALDVNLLGPFLGMKLAIEHMKGLDGGVIINIASNSTREVLPITAAYSPSKAALANLTKVAAVHCAKEGYNIRVNSVHPGPSETAMVTDGGDLNDVFSQLIPMKRLGQPREIGQVVAFLVSDGASYMTGEEVFVDGGMTVSMA